jgi:hypothetical protein
MIEYHMISRSHGSHISSKIWGSLIYTLNWSITGVAPSWYNRFVCESEIVTECFYKSGSGRVA